MVLNSYDLTWSCNSSKWRFSCHCTKKPYVTRLLMLYSFCRCYLQFYGNHKQLQHWFIISIFLFPCFVVVVVDVYCLLFFFIIIPFVECNQWHQRLAFNIQFAQIARFELLLCTCLFFANIYKYMRDVNSSIIFCMLA